VNLPLEAKTFAGSINECLNNPRWTRLIEQIAARDETAFAAFYDCTCKLLYGLIFKILNHNKTAEEVLENVYLEIWQHAGEFKVEEEKALIWLIGIARKHAFKSLRERSLNQQSKARSKTSFFNDSSYRSAPLSNPEGEPTTHKLVCEALDKLPPAQRIAIELTYFFGMSLSEISSYLEQPRELLETDLKLGMNNFRAALSAKKLKP
jgi:RNA polymerase sigma-70 factor, ECF subfamily